MMKHLKNSLLAICKPLSTQAKIIRAHRLGLLGTAIILFFSVIAIFAPLIAPYEVWEPTFENGKIQSLKGPSLKYSLGTTFMGRDVFSQLVYATRTTLLIGSLSGLISILIGATLGLFAGYYGGILDDIVMRFTDVIYGMPFLPFIIVLISLLGRNIWWVMIAITCIVWRTSARVIRAEMLSLKERQFVTLAKARGCGDFRIIFRHILPNILPLLLLYTAFNMAWAILAEAGASFLGFGDPDVISWGGMLYNLWISGKSRVAWWWFLFPSLCIVLLVSSFIFVSQAYEEVANPRLKER